MITIHGSHYNVHFLSTLVSLCQHQVIRGWACSGREGVRLGMGELSGRVHWLVVEVGHSEAGGEEVERS